MAKIDPTVGRVVLYSEGKADAFPGSHEQRAAVVAQVNTNGTVNLAVFDSDGNAHARQKVVLVQDGQKKPDGPFCEWMAYQVSQAAKTQDTSKLLADTVAQLAGRVTKLEQHGAVGSPGGTKPGITPAKPTPTKPTPSTVIPGPKAKEEPKPPADGTHPEPPKGDVSEK